MKAFLSGLATFLAIVFVAMMASGRCTPVKAGPVHPDKPQVHTGVPRGR